MDARDLVGTVSVWSSKAWDHTFRGRGSQLSRGTIPSVGGGQLSLEPDTYDIIIYTHKCTHTYAYAPAAYRAHKARCVCVFADVFEPS